MVQITRIDSALIEKKRERDFAHQITEVIGEDFRSELGELKQAIELAIGVQSAYLKVDEVGKEIEEPVVNLQMIRGLKQSMGIKPKQSLDLKRSQSLYKKELYDYILDVQNEIDGYLIIKNKIEEIFETYKEISFKTFLGKEVLEKIQSLIITNFSNAIDHLAELILLLEGMNLDDLELLVSKFEKTLDDFEKILALIDQLAVLFEDKANGEYVDELEVLNILYKNFLNISVYDIEDISMLKQASWPIQDCVEIEMDINGNYSKQKSVDPKNSFKYKFPDVEVFDAVNEEVNQILIERAIKLIEDKLISFSKNNVANSNAVIKKTRAMLGLVGNLPFGYAAGNDNVALVECESILSSLLNGPDALKIAKLVLLKEKLLNLDSNNKEDWDGLIYCFDEVQNIFSRQSNLYRANNKK